MFSDPQLQARALLATSGVHMCHRICNAVARRAKIWQDHISFSALHQFALLLSLLSLPSLVGELLKVHVHISARSKKGHGTQNEPTVQ